jgi:hypothetical protein
MQRSQRSRLRLPVVVAEIGRLRQQLLCASKVRSEVLALSTRGWLTLTSRGLQRYLGLEAMSIVDVPTDFLPFEVFVANEDDCLLAHEQV